MLRFLLVGTSRSGLGYAAQVLNRAGIACGHGWVYSPAGVRRYPEVEIVGDAAPLAAPHAGDFTGLVFHQVRHPLKVIGSLVGSAPLGNPLTHGPEGHFLARHFVSHGDPLDDAMRYYVNWNTRCERHNGYLRYQIEDLGPRLILRIADLISRPVDAAAVAQAFAAVPSDFNTRYSARRLSWSDLPEGPSRTALERLSARYGYPADDPAPVIPAGASIG
jgi:hypothetical protein